MELMVDESDVPLCRTTAKEQKSQFPEQRLFRGENAFRLSPLSLNSPTNPLVLPFRLP